MTLCLEPFPIKLDQGLIRFGLEKTLELKS